MALLVFLLLLAPAALVVGQPGFLSIDCGLPVNYSGYTDVRTGIVYVSDSPYVDAGETHKVSAEFEAGWANYRPFQTLRSFPSGVRNCYALPTVAGAKYLLRMDMAYGNYDGKNSQVAFDVHLGVNIYLGTFTANLATDTVYEAVFMAWASWAPLCLVNIARGTPFLSSLELRPLPGTLYPHVTSNLSLLLYSRQNWGAQDYHIIRWPDDPHDRFWWGWENVNPLWVNLSTTSAIQPDPSFVVPLPVLQTAVSGASNDSTFTIVKWQEQRKLYSFMVFLHFADFQNAQHREFDIYFNGNRLGQSEKSYIPPFLTASCVHSSSSYRSTDGNYDITLSANAKSVLPPTINAVEIYYAIFPQENPTTFPKDFDAIMAIKFEYGLKKNWTGDPCFPTNYAWDGVKCGNTSDNNMRIISIDLSNSHLKGAISENFMLLTAIENLDLSYNNMTGSIPDSLLSLPYLRVLNLLGNNLSDNSLCKQHNASLVFRYDGHMCNKTKSPSKARAAVLAISVVVPVLLIAVLPVAYIIWRKNRKLNDPQLLQNGQGSRKTHGDYLENSKNRRFTYKELKKFTNNFKRSIGKGGFGAVYYGRLEDSIEVAVKMRSESSSHGLAEFIAEVHSLSKVHHRSLVSLVGYCWEKGHLALVYEYMSQGSLCDHLRGKHDVAQALNWGTRLRVLLEAARGLDYLHKGCNMPIVHRDLKTSNILLGHNLQAKIADFGLSKTYLSDTQTHISATNLAGTAGYIDPEYQHTGRLTESCDVYSFGVVVLEVVTGEAPTVLGHGHIVQRVKQKIATGDIRLIADVRLGGSYDINSMWKVVEIAMMCTEDSAAQRPTMATVMVMLKESLALEEAREKKDSSVMASPGTDSAALMSRDGPLA